MEELGGFSQTLTELQQTVRHAPDDAKAHFYLSQCYLNQDQLREAVAAWDKALELDPNLATEEMFYGQRIRQAQGQMLLREKRYDEAVELYEGLLPSSPDIPFSDDREEIHRRLIEAYRGLGRTDKIAFHEAEIERLQQAKRRRNLLFALPLTGFLVAGAQFLSFLVVLLGVGLGCLIKGQPPPPVRSIPWPFGSVLKVYTLCFIWPMLVGIGGLAWIFWQDLDVTSSIWPLVWAVLIALGVSFMLFFLVARRLFVRCFKVFFPDQFPRPAERVQATLHLLGWELLTVFVVNLIAVVLLAIAAGVVGSFWVGSSGA